MELPPARPLSWPERAVVAVDATVGIVVTVLAVLLFAASVGDESTPNDPHGGAWGLITAVLAATSGLAFLLAAVGVARRWRGRWWLHLLPLVLPGVVAMFGISVLSVIGIVVSAG